MVGARKHGLPKVSVNEIPFVAEERLYIPLSWQMTKTLVLMWSTWVIRDYYGSECANC